LSGSFKQKLSILGTFLFHMNIPGKSIIKELNLSKLGHYILLNGNGRLILSLLSFTIITTHSNLNTSCPFK